MTEYRITMDYYFNHPGDKEIIFEVPLDLTEIKHLHYCLLKKLDAEKEEGYMGGGYSGSGYEIRGSY